MSSDGTPASDLDATLDIQILGGNQLQLTLTNDTTSPNEFSINQVFWNGSSAVSGLTLLSATHSVNGDVFAAWNPVETDTMVNGFGVFDFGLTDGVGETNPDIVDPGESIVFLLSIAGTCAGSLSCTDADFVVANASGYIAAAKFVNGPDDPESPGNEDSAFGAVIPEPGTAALVGGGLLSLAIARRRRA